MKDVEVIKNHLDVHRVALRLTWQCWECQQHDNKRNHCEQCGRSLDSTL